jgi:CRP/FNR family transcriptional regulator, cyclic AMP receptor protein
VKETTERICARMKGELAAFHFLQGEDITELAPFFLCRQVHAGEVLWHEGDPCNFMAFIVEGRIDIKKETEFKGKQIIVGVYGKGSIVGELCLLDGSSRAVSAVALTDTDLLILSRENLEQLLELHPRMGVKLLKGMLLAVSIRLRKSFDRLATIF